MTKQKLNNKITVNRTAPINLNYGDFDLFQHELVRTFPESYYLQIDEVDIQNNLLFKNTSVLKLISLNTPFFLDGCRYYLKYILKRNIKNKIRVNEVIWLTDHWSSNYFHWLSDCLPKLFALKPHKETVIFLPNNYKDVKYIGDSLAILGYKVNYIKPGIVYSLGKLTIPKLVAPTGNFIPELLLRLRLELKETLDIPKVPPTEFIFINRKNNTRQIENFNQVERILQKYNINIVYTEGLTLNEQICLFNNTKLLIGVHGAGLTNMLFLQSKTTVFELRKKGDKLNNCYFSMASALDINYAYQLCEVNDYRLKTQENNFMIDINEFDKNLELLINSY